MTLLLARGLSRDKYEIHLVLVTQSEVPTAPPPGVTVHALGAKRVRRSAFQLLRLLRRLRPRLIFSGIAHLNLLVLLLRPLLPLRTRVLVRQSATLSSALAACPKPRFHRVFYRLLYCRSDAIVCQSRAMADDLCAQLRIAPEKLAVLPNPLDLSRIRAARESPSLWSGPGPHLLAIGRLAHEKGFDLLIEAFAAVRARFARADLLIAGDGNQRAALKAHAHRLSLDSAVRFAGHVDSPFHFYPGATLFVLSSRHEGMPNALLEAAAAGLPLAATPASGGVTDLLAGCAGAWLAPSISAPALAETLLRALDELSPGQRFLFPFFSSPAQAAPVAQPES